MTFPPVSQHSCDPNLTMHIVRIDSFIPSMALFAARDISAGEELTYDYGAPSVSNDETPPRQGGVKCLCGASNCKGYLPFDETL